MLKNKKPWTDELMVQECKNSWLPLMQPKSKCGFGFVLAVVSSTQGRLCPPLSMPVPLEKKSWPSIYNSTILEF